MRSLRRKFSGKGSLRCQIIDKDTHNPRVTANSRVVASISEYNSNGPFIGNASLRVLSVAPNDNGEIWVKVYVD
ncbi:MAG TPA: hypothetical protein VD815_03020 [Candidatus Saccharimonadales bacterium]|nr:hypothetical protein [Candidatus Saccharimonadales bacterium]